MEQLPISDLRNLLTTLNLDATGTKPQMLKILKEYNEAKKLSPVPEEPSRTVEPENPSDENEESQVSTPLENVEFPQAHSSGLSANPRNTLLNDGEDHDNLVNPEDSVSEASRHSECSVNSRISSIFSTRLKRALEAADRAALAAKAQKLKEKQKVQEQIFRAQQQNQLIDIEAQIEESNAREMVLSQFEDELSNLSIASRTSNKAAKGLKILKTGGFDRNLPPRRCPTNEQTVNRKFKPEAVTFAAEAPKTFRSENAESGGQPESFASVDDSMTPLAGDKRKPRSDENHEDLMNTLISYNLKSLMPKANVEPFSGDLTTYRTFIRAFDSVISSKLVDDGEKLLFLEQFTRQKLREIVRSCLEMPAEEGYKEARKILEKKYGNPIHMNNAYIQKIISHPNIKVDDIEMLDKFLLLLIGCKNAMTSLPVECQETEHPKTIQKIVEKLAAPLQDKWCKRVFDIYEKNSRQGAFEDLVKFIDREVQIASHPVYGRIAMTSSKNMVHNFTNNVNDKRPRVSCNLIRNESFEKKSTPCVYCREEHYFTRCPIFEKLPIDVKMNFIREQALCFSCLRMGHRSKLCRNKLRCQLCNERHPTTLHENCQRHEMSSKSANAGKPFNSPSPAATDDKQEDILTSTEHRIMAKKVNARDEEITKRSILPVKVQRDDGSFVPTYAFIDGGSTSSFCSEELLSKIKCKNVTSTSICITTATDKCVRKRNNIISNLVICDQGENHLIKLPPVNTLPEIHVSVDEVITNQDLKTWPHLSNLNLPELNAKVGLLIGNNILQATEPWQIIHSSVDGEPYALKTKLGWVVKGFSRSTSTEVDINSMSLTHANADDFYYCEIIFFFLTSVIKSAIYY